MRSHTTRPALVALLVTALAPYAPALGQPAAAPAPAGTAAKAPYWLAAMQKVHADFTGQAGYVAQLGDSITYSMAFWSPMGWADPSPFLPKDDPLPAKPSDKRWRDVILGARDKGPKAGNYSGWTVGQLLRVVDKVLQETKPEVALVMIGTNDISGGRVPKNYQAGVEKVITKCLAAKCIPILNTIPPRRGRAKAVAEANAIIRALARKHRVPLVDYHAEILQRRPGETWAGTLIGNDGVHPTAGKTQVYDEENLTISGYALRNWVNFLAYREVYFRVLHPKQK